MSYYDELNELVAPAEQTLEKDLVALETQRPSRRKQRYTDIKENQEYFNDEFRQTYSEKLEQIFIQDINAQFTTARLFLHVASRRDNRAESIAPEAFTEDEIQAAKDFDRYRAFDISDEEDLERRIRNKDDEIYEFVVDEIVSQTGDHVSVLESQHNQIRGEIMDYLNHRYQERLEKSREAVALYIEHHGLPDVIESIEEAIDASADGALTRQEVEEVIGSQLDELSEMLHATLREQERAIRSDIADVEGELVATGLHEEEIDIDTDDLEAQLRRIEDQIEGVRQERRADVQALDDAIEKLSAQRTKIDEKIDELEETSADAATKAAGAAADDLASKAERVVLDELNRLEDQREEIESELARLSRERERLEVAGERLEDKQADLRERVEQVTDSLPGDETAPTLEASNVVPARIARLYEVDFINRFNQSMQETAGIVLPSGEEFQPGPNFEADMHESSDERGRMKSLLEEQDRETEPVDHYPLQRRSRYTVVTRSPLGLIKESELIVEATVHSHLQTYAQNGFDAQPAGLDDLLDVINRVTDRAARHETPHLIGVASTTGWTDRVRRLVAEEEFSRTQLGSDVSLCLVDLRTGELVYDQSDELLRANRALFERAVLAERIEACEQVVRDEYLAEPGRTTVPVSNVTDKTDFSAHVVSSAFDRIEEDGDASKAVHPDHGPYLYTEDI